MCHPRAVPSGLQLGIARRGRRFRQLVPPAAPVCRRRFDARASGEALFQALVGADLDARRPLPLVAPLARSELCHSLRWLAWPPVSFAGRAGLRSDSTRALLHSVASLPSFPRLDSPAVAAAPRRHAASTLCLPSRMFRLRRPDCNPAHSPLGPQAMRNTTPDQEPRPSALRGTPAATPAPSTPARRPVEWVMGSPLYSDR